MLGFRRVVLFVSAAFILQAQDVCSRYFGLSSNSTIFLLDVLVCSITLHLHSFLSWLIALQAWISLSQLRPPKKLCYAQFWLLIASSVPFQAFVRSDFGSVWPKTVIRVGIEICKLMAKIKWKRVILFSTVGLFSNSPHKMFSSWCLDITYIFKLKVLKVFQ